MTSLSVIVITRNEAAQIADCLRSVPFAQQWVVLDSASSDDTQQIAASLGAQVHASPDWPGFGVQKNRALDWATGDWVLSIDADERVTPELASAIQAILQDPPSGIDAYALSRLSSYCGQYMRHSGWYPDPVVRLFRRGTARFSDDLVHEKLQVTGTVGQLAGTLLHKSFADLESVLDKLNRYSSAGAQALQTRGKKSSLSQALGHGLWAFVRTYVLRCGFLDGRLGLVLALSNAQGAYYKYLKLWLLQRPAPARTES